MWCGVVWCGVVWCGVVWCGVVWCGVVWCGVVWCGVVWCGVVWCGVVWCGVVWCGAVTEWQWPGWWQRHQHASARAGARAPPPLAEDPQPPQQGRVVRTSGHTPHSARLDTQPTRLVFSLVQGKARKHGYGMQGAVGTQTPPPLVACLPVPLNPVPSSLSTGHQNIRAHGSVAEWEVLGVEPGGLSMI